MTQNFTKHDGSSMNFYAIRPFFFLKGLIFVLIITGLVLSYHGLALAFNPKEATLSIQNVSTLKNLIDQSDVIAQGRLDPSVQKFRLGKHVNKFELINTIQFFTIDHKIKGAPPTKIQLLTTGLTPLPDKDSPLNLEYPGELAPGHYILFLKPIPDTPYYRLTSGMQSVYPLISGRTIALKDASGFGQLDQLTSHQFEKTIKQTR